MHDSPRLASTAGVPLQQLTERMRRQQDQNAVHDPMIVEDIVTAVMDTLSGRLSPMEATLLREVAELGRIIQDAKTGIADDGLGAINRSHIPSATDELGAIVEHTAAATNSILENAEILDKLANELERPQAVILQAATMAIYEACGFQDITGQRITKVVKALRAIEARVIALSSTFATAGAAGDLITAARAATGGTGAALMTGAGSASVAAAASVAEHDTLLNGPMLAHEAMGQDEIDALLNDF